MTSMWSCQGDAVLVPGLLMRAAHSEQSGRMNLLNQFLNHSTWYSRRSGVIQPQREAPILAFITYL